MSVFNQRRKNDDGGGDGDVDMVPADEVQKELPQEKKSQEQQSKEQQPQQQVHSKQPQSRQQPDKQSQSQLQDDETVCLNHILLACQKILCSFCRLHQQQKRK